MGKIIGIIAVDGLDGCGKSTFVTKLSNALGKYLPNGVFPLTDHLPSYQSASGLKLLEFLNDTSTKMNLDKCKEMMILNGINKSDFYCRMGTLAMELPSDVVLVLDRFVASNYIYSAPYFKNLDEMFQYGAQIDEFCRMPKPDVQVCLFCDPKLRLERINKRKEKQIYELDKFQTKLDKNYKDVILRLKDEKKIKRSPLLIPSDVFDEEWQKKQSMNIDCKELEKVAILKTLHAFNRVLRASKEYEAMKLPRIKMRYNAAMNIFSEDFRSGKCGDNK